MPIKVACSCGQSFAAPDNLAGRTVKCPKCSQPLSIPAVQPQQPAAPVSGGVADLLAEEGLAAKAGSGPQCPSCNSPMPPHGFICVQCGYNVQLGRRVQTHDATAHTAERDAQQLLAKARKALDETPQEFSADDLGAGANAYIAAVVIVIATIFIVGTGAGAFYLFGEMIEGSGGAGAGMAAVLTGMLFGSIGGIWLLVVAFMEDITKGLLCLFCGPYFLFFVFTHAGENKLPAMLYFLGAMMQFGGILMIGFSGAK
jgi:hypothetical protein